MQSTGLLDKNGQEIFEGDIVEASHVWWGGADTSQTAVKWNPHGASGIAAFWPFFEHNSKHCPTCCCEVIGNIHENPELING